MNWFPWLRTELETAGFEVIVPVMPEPEMPKPEEWVGEIKNAVGTPDKHTIFVGHSLGCPAIASYLERLPEDVEIGGAIFVAGFATSLGRELIEPFVSRVFDFGRIVSHSPGKFFVIMSDNDRRVPLGASLDFARSLAAETLLESNKGHFRTRDGVSELPSVRDIVFRLAKAL